MFTRVEYECENCGAPHIHHWKSEAGSSATDDGAPNALYRRGKCSNCGYWQSWSLRGKKVAGVVAPLFLALVFSPFTCVALDGSGPVVVAALFAAIWSVAALLALVAWRRNLNSAFGELRPVRRYVVYRVQSIQEPSRLVVKQPRPDTPACGSSSVAPTETADETSVRVADASLGVGDPLPSDVRELEALAVDGDARAVVALLREADVTSDHEFERALDKEIEQGHDLSNAQIARRRELRAEGQAAADTLKGLGIHAVGPLAGALIDGNLGGYDSRVAMEILRRIGVPAADFLRDLLRDPNENTRKRARELLEGIDWEQPNQ